MITLTKEMVIQCILEDLKAEAQKEAMARLEELRASIEPDNFTVAQLEAGYIPKLPKSEDPK